MTEFEQQVLDLLRSIGICAGAFVGLVGGYVALRIIIGLPRDRGGYGIAMAEPWQTEPDRADWMHRDLHCALRRGPGQHWCGYVGVAVDHPLHSLDVLDVREISVHGRITYAEAYVCGLDGLWWFGFDCGHICDVLPEPARRAEFGSLCRRRSDLYDGFDDSNPVYRVIAYAKAETNKLAEQLDALGKEQ